MVAAGEADVLCTGILYCSNPLLCVETVGVESVGSLGIFCLVNRVVLQIPFALCEHAVYSPMDEDTELAVGKLLTCFQVLGCWGVLCLCN